MPPDPPKKPPPDPAELIARAKRDAAAQQAEQILARMQEDDERDERDGVEPSDSSNPSFGSGGPLSSGVDSEEWDLSGRASSRRGSSVIDEGSLAGGATMAEGSAKSPTTLNVPLDAALARGDNPAEPSDPPAPDYRPERRPPMATLVACDDGRPTGEELRLRKTAFDVGRIEGDLVIAHDHQMSRRHFRIERRHASGVWEWSLKDLDSLNGTFLQQPSARIDDGDEFLLAGEVIKVRHAGGGKLTLVKVATGSAEERVTLDPGEHLLGADADACAPLLTGAPLLAPRHLRLESDRTGRWTATALEGTDGFWLRTPGFKLTDGAEWQTGEQRFVFRLP